MSNLLHVIKFTKTKATGAKKTPILLEDLPVDPLTAPYLVTSSSGVLWLDKPHPGNVVKAAVRTITPGELFTELLNAIIERSITSEWGSVVPYSGKGLGMGFEYLDSYDLTDVELLIPPTPANKRPVWMQAKNLAIPVRPSSWIPKGIAVLLPRDRNYVGVLGHLDGKRVAAVVHNASRGVVILRGKDELAK